MFANRFQVVPASTGFWVVDTARGGDAITWEPFAAETEAIVCAVQLEQEWLKEIAKIS